MESATRIFSVAMLWGDPGLGIIWRIKEALAFVRRNATLEVTPLERQFTRSQNPLQVFSFNGKRGVLRSRLTVVER